VTALLAVLLACAEEPAPLPPCPREDSEAWLPDEDTAVREDHTTLAWASRPGSALEVLPAGEACASGCVDLDGVMDARFVMERGVVHTATARWEGLDAATLEVHADNVNGPVLLESTLIPGHSARHTLVATGAARTFVVTVAGRGTLHDLRLEGPRWRDPGPVTAAPGAVLDFAVLMHIEAEPALVNLERAFRRRAEVVEGISRTLAAHGGRLTLQADASFARGIAAWDDAWVDARRDEGMAFSLHGHSEDAESRSLLADVRDARRRWEDVGVEVRDLNGGFALATWPALASAGVRSLTAWKDRAAQAGLPAVRLQPWRPAPEAVEADAFVRHDAHAPLIYLPGSPTTEPDPLRFAETLPGVIRQAIVHARPDQVNTWYVVIHVDQFGIPFEDDPVAYDRWLAEGGLEDELAPLDALLTTVVDPLLADGSLRWSTPDLARERQETWERACAEAATALSRPPSESRHGGG
jgi:hypothetical protein